MTGAQQKGPQSHNQSKAHNNCNFDGQIQNIFNAAQTALQKTKYAAYALWKGYGRRAKKISRKASSYNTKLGVF